MKLHPDYERFLEEQTHIRPSSLRMYQTALLNLPEPNRVTAAWFRRQSKKWSPYTLRQRLIIAKSVLKYLEIEHDLDKVKIPRTEPSVTVEDLYTKEELVKIFKATHTTRDRALLEVLYESACRAGEVLSMKIENLTFEDGTVSVTVAGKTGTREVYLKESVPALNAWLNVHPSGKGDLWMSSQTMRGIKIQNLHFIVRQAIKKAKIKRQKKRVVHMFRHTRITELVTMGFRGQALKRYVGWAPKSEMESIYVHLSTHDVKTEVRDKVFGLVAEEERPKPLLESKTCLRCSTVNEPFARYCSKCNMPISDDALVQELEKRQSQEDRIKNLEDEVLTLRKFVDHIVESADEKGRAAEEIYAKFEPES